MGRSPASPASDVSDVPEPVTDRPLRKDAQRNREILLAAAAEAYGERGVDASLEDIARRAGVGIGTLYRHFPTRDALNEAVYRREVETLCDGIDQLLADHSAVDALAIWMRSFATYVARKRGMAVALKSALGPDNELFAHSQRRIRETLGTLVTAAVESGGIRADADSEDLLRAMSGICMATDSAALPGSAAASERTGRLVDLLIDGLRYRAPSPS